jgi:hypothetical protein
MLSHILFNQRLKKWSYQCNLQSIHLLEGDASFNHVISISSNAPSKQERVLLSSSDLPPSPEEVPFDWDSLLGYPIPSPRHFQVRDVIQYMRR